MRLNTRPVTICDREKFTAYFPIIVEKRKKFATIPAVLRKKDKKTCIY